MIAYKRGSEVSMKELHQAFSIGFSDYMIKLSLSEEAFEERFFGPEGNGLETSIVAFDGDVPVGVLLGGIRYWEGIKTLRCGALAIHPDYRGRGISQAMMRLHGEDAKREACKRMSLEVIKGNDRAIKFYEHEGYIKAGSLKYYHLDAKAFVENEVARDEETVSCLPVGLEACTWEQLQASRKKRSQHLHWQGEPSYYEHSISDFHYHLVFNGANVGMCSISAGGRINYLWVDPDQRFKGLARGALLAMIREHQLEKCHLAMASNPNMECFAVKMGFQKDPLEQHEMFKMSR